MRTKATGTYKAEGQQESQESQESQELLPKKKGRGT